MESKKKKDLETILVELTSARLANEESFLNCGKSIIGVLLDLCVSNKPTELINATKDILTQWSPLFLKFMLDQQDQVEVIYHIQEYCEKNDKMEKKFQLILHTLYQNDVLDEASIFSWADEQEKADSAENKRFLLQCEKFLNWLKEAEEDD